MGRKLFVGNLSFNTDERRLEELFQTIGPVDSVNIVRDQMTGRARGFAFVEMQSEEAAKTAIEKLNETDAPHHAVAGVRHRSSFNHSRRPRKLDCDPRFFRPAEP